MDGAQLRKGKEQPFSIEFWLLLIMPNKNG
jgi:hypothetical protein